MTSRLTRSVAKGAGWAATLLVAAASTQILPAAPAMAATASIAVAPLASVYKASTTYTMTVNGISVPINGYQDYDYAEFAMGAGNATVTITKLNATNVGAAYISPLKYGYKATFSGSRATFTMTSAQYLIVKLDGQRRLILAADPTETDKPAKTGTGIFNVTSSTYAADSTGARVTTPAVQKALDAASAYGSVAGHTRGIVYIPRGVYLVANLDLNSNTAVYLEDGAVLRAPATKSLYTKDAYKSSQSRDLTWWIQTAFGSTNIKLYGRGTLDGNGQANATAGIGTNILAPIATSNFTLDGLTIRESGSWAVIPTRSNDLSFSNMKLFNRFDMGENDGIDVIESQNVTVTRGIGIGLDDPYSTKTWPKATTTGTDITYGWPGEAEALSNVTFDNLVSWTYCYGFKVGQGMAEDQSGVTFKNSVVFDAAIGLGIHHKWGAGTASGITFSNMDIENLSYSNDSRRTWLVFLVYDGYNDGAGPITGVNVTNINVRNKGTTPAVMRGISDTAAISNVTFNSVKMPGASTYATTMAGMNLTDRAFVSGVTILPVQDPEPVS
ncbi:MAG: hypothetical protein QOJ50_1479 [Cryptosporangiaceae bacterium]|nr:hypothetical protein [Cryptosporangiaceae bacterium]